MCNLPVARYRGLVTYEKRPLTAGPCCRVSDTALLCCWFRMHIISVFFLCFFFLSSTIASLLCNVRLLANLRVAVFLGVGVWNFNGSWFIYLLCLFLSTESMARPKTSQKQDFVYIAYVFEVTLFEADSPMTLGCRKTPPPQINENSKQLHESMLYN